MQPNTPELEDSNTPGSLTFRDQLMNINHFDVKKTGLLFFDILNGYYHAAEPSIKARMKPWIENGKAKTD